MSKASSWEDRAKAEMREEGVQFDSGDVSAVASLKSVYEGVIGAIRGELQAMDQWPFAWTYGEGPRTSRAGPTCASASRGPDEQQTESAAAKRDAGTGEQARFRVRILRDSFEAGNEATNSFILIAPEGSQPVPDGALSGLIFGVKDNIDVRGLPTSMGSSVSSTEPVDSESPVVTALRSAGALVAGKTNLGEHALDATTCNPCFGPTRNPWDLSRIAGGSSGGSAASVAAGLVDFALGTDSGGSIRVPAAMCGVVGFRPSAGFWPLDGLRGAAWSVDSIGLIARDVATVVRVCRETAPRAAARALFGSSVRIGVVDDDSMGKSHRDVDRLLSHAVHRMIPAGHTVSHVSFRGLERSAPVLAMIAYCEVASQHTEGIRKRAAEYGVPPRHLLQLGSILRAVDYLDAQRMRSAIITRYAGIVNGLDIIATPTLPVTAPLIGVDARVPDDDSPLAIFTLIRFTCVANLLGIPSISIPMGFDSDGMPVGLQLLGQRGSDWDLLHAAALVERALGSDGVPDNAVSDLD